MIYGFEDYVLDVDRQELRRAGTLSSIEPQVLDLLLYLIRNRHHVVSKDDLIAHVWKGRIVSESTLTSRLAAARHALNDSGKLQRLIRTVSRKGVRFIGEVRECETPTGEGSRSPMSQSGEFAAATPILPDKPSIAVLPFANKSGDSAQDYFSDGIAEDIVTALSRVSELVVIAWNSSLQFRGNAIDRRQIALRLGVRFLLEGSIRRSGERVRITVQLIEVQSGAHRWADRYERKLDDIFAVQDEISYTVAALLASHVNKAESERTMLKPPATWEAYDYYLRAADAYAAFHRSTNVETLYGGRRFLAECIARDPSFAPAFVLQSAMQISAWGLPLDADYLSAEALERAYGMAQRALQADPNLAQARAQLSCVLSFKGQNEAALAELERAIVLNPNLTDWRFALVLIHAGQAERAVDAALAHLRLDPFALPIARGFLGLALYLLGRYSEAVAALREFVAQSPDHRPGRAWLTAAYAQLGRMNDAHAEASHVLRIDPEWTCSGIFRKGGYLPDPYVDRLVDGLRKAGLPA